MRSIRLSLVVYFLALLSVALTVASLLLYDTAQRTLCAKERATRALIAAQCEERGREARQRLDERLLAQAKSLAGRTRPQYRWERLQNYHFHTAGAAALVAGLSNNRNRLGSLVNLVQVPLVLSSAKGLPKGARRFVYWTPAQNQIWRHYIIDLALSRDVEMEEEAGWPRFAYRIETNGWSLPLPPPASQGLTLPCESEFAPDERLTWVIDDVRLASDVPVRRVRFRSLITLESRPGFKDVGRPGFPPFRAPPASIIIQCAADLRELDAVLEGLAEQREQEIAALREETEAALARHRDRLFWISGSTFAASALGSLLLVWLGLTPLSRLSEAVSRVSPKNFALDVEPAGLPRELRPIAERLATTLELLRRAFAREKQATADISHELRTPLAAMLTTIELALRKPRTQDQYREFLSDCHGSATQMHQIVERLLTLARLDAGVDRLRAQAVDVAELARQCIGVIRPLAEARGLKLAVYDRRTDADSTEEEESPLMTDPDKLREVLTNLLHNAVQYNRPEGRIDLTVARENGAVKLEVSDTGIGIADGVRERIFERFYRADPSRNADDLHAGLGLAIVKEYVELMGGRITVESQEGQGSTFRVELPVHGPAQAG